MIRRILHTSDWHLGRRLKEHDRSKEFADFLSWLENLIRSKNIDTLLIAGDIFDNTTPPVPAQKLYYSFLSRLKNTPCRHTVIISGNHDSPSFLDAPSELLKLCKIHVIGQACENPASEVLPLYDSDGKLEMIVCAVPYLRDKDVRTLTASDNPSDTERAITEGIRNHYAQVFTCAQELQKNSNVPVIAMGHMFIQGGKTRPDDGVRSLYVGTALQIDADIFPEWITYTALGHLHSPQKAGRENIRYSGSPLAMGFGEAGQKKSVYILELDGNNLTDLREISIPNFQRLARVSGDLAKIFSQLRALAEQNKSVWCDVTYTGEEIIADLHERLQAFTVNFPAVEILSIHDESKRQTAVTTEIPDGLDHVKPIEMLKLCFEENNTPEEQREIFIPMYLEILRDLGEDY